MTNQNRVGRAAYVLLVDMRDKISDGRWQYVRTLFDRVDFDELAAENIFKRRYRVCLVIDDEDNVERNVADVVAAANGDLAPSMRLRDLAAQWSDIFDVIPRSDVEYQGNLADGDDTEWLTRWIANHGGAYIRCATDPNAVGVWFAIAGVTLVVSTQLAQQIERFTPRIEWSDLN